MKTANDYQSASNLAFTAAKLAKVGEHNGVDAEQVAQTAATSRWLQMAKQYYNESPSVMARKLEAVERTGMNRPPMDVDVPAYLKQIAKLQKRFRDHAAKGAHYLP